MGDCLSYFIAGLPRSRTAWLSVFMSQSGMYCHHDGFNGCKSMFEYGRKIKGCGDSSTGLTLIDLNKVFPDSKVVVIEKTELELGQCIEWCNLAYGGDSRDQILKMNDKLLKIKGLRIKQSDIDSRLQDIWGHLVPTKWHDKYKRLTHFNIQADPYNIDLKAAKAFYASLQ